MCPEPGSTLQVSSGMNALRRAEAEGPWAQARSKLPGVESAGGDFGVSEFRSFGVEAGKAAPDRSQATEP